VNLYNITMTKKEKRRDKMLRRVYGKSLAWYRHQFKRQGGHCFCCDFVPEKGKLPLHVEHDHRLAKAHVFTVPMGRLWIAFTAEFGVIKQSHKKRRAVRLMKKWLKRKSVRGLVCWPCNSLIRKSYDQPDRMFKAAKLLDAHQKKMKWRKYAA